MRTSKEYAQLPDLIFAQTQYYYVLAEHWAVVCFVCVYFGIQARQNKDMATHARNSFSRAHGPVVSFAKHNKTHMSPRNKLLGVQKIITIQPLFSNLSRDGQVSGGTMYLQ